jgi:uncharacterized protein (TIGR04222 family)
MLRRPTTLSASRERMEVAMVDAYHMVTAALLLMALAVRLRWPGVARVELRPTEVALLRGGRRAAVVTALVLLHARAAVDGDFPGRARRCGPLPRGCDPLARIIYASLVQPAGPRELMLRPAVRRALARLETDLAAARLTVATWRRAILFCLAAAAGGVAAAGWAAAGRASAGVPMAAVAVAIAGLAVLSRRTLTGRRTVRSLRRRYADLPPEHELVADWTPRSLGLAVALHGTPALRLTFPRLATQRGLLDRAA